MNSIIRKYRSITIENKIRIICRLEIITLLLFAISRIQLVFRIKNMDQGLRNLINLIDYENGWTFYFIILSLLGSSLIIYNKINWTAWNLKIISFICLIFKAGFLHWYISIYCITGIIFYSSKTIKSRFTYFDRIHWIDRHLFIPVSILLIIIGEVMTILIY